MRKKPKVDIGCQLEFEFNISNKYGCRNIRAVGNDIDNFATLIKFPTENSVLSRFRERVIEDLLRNKVVVTD